jgi:hypothetical protein
MSMYDMMVDLSQSARIRQLEEEAEELKERVQNLERWVVYLKEKDENVQRTDL